MADTGEVCFDLRFERGKPGNGDLVDNDHDSLQGARSVNMILNFKKVFRSRSGSKQGSIIGDWYLCSPVLWVSALQDSNSAREVRQA